MPLFEVPKRNIGKSTDKKIVGRIQDVKIVAPSIKGGNTILSRINEIKATVEKNLGQYRDEYQLIQDEDLLHDFITECIGNGYISIDTETDGLDPLQNTLAGICPYTYGQKGSYIPINHISYITQTKLPGQLSMDFIVKEFKRLLDKKPKIDMFNAPFDTRFLRANGITDIYCTWDGYLASRILNENEEHKDLKHLHNKYCLNGVGDAFRFDDLFKGIPFTHIPPNVGYLYAAHDPVITTELCDYQRKYLTPDSPREDIRNMYYVFHDIEMACIPVVTSMEDTGVLFDTEYANKLSVEYNQKLKEAEQNFYRTCDDFGSELDNYRQKMGANNKLEYPININSSTQIAITLYDVLKLPSVDKKYPRGTGENILEKLDHPIVKSILQYREIKKLLTTYIDKLPECINPKDGRIHCKFNQYGADTGRFSSSDPNLQNIPSRNHDIRKMFIATQEEKIVNFDTDDFLEVDKFTEIFTNDEWVPVSRLGIGDTIDIYGELFTISNIEESNERVRIYL